MVSGEERADIVIIGSGFGGAVAALRLGSPERKVVVLERGRDWSLPENGMTPGYVARVMETYVRLRPRRQKAG